MVKEAYCSFEIAQLLKNKGFNEILYPCYKVCTGKQYGIYDGKPMFCRTYNGEYAPCFAKNSSFDEYTNHDGIYYVSAPSLAFAMQWLIEEHNLCIEPYRTACGYLYTISRVPTGTELYSDKVKGDDEFCSQWTTYEKAVEAAIKYCLENLI